MGARFAAASALILMIARASAWAQATDTPEFPESRSSKPLLLIPRENPNRIFGIRKSTKASRTEVPSIKEFSGEFSQDEWNRMRDEIERGIFFEDEPSTLPYEEVLGTAAVKAEPAPPPPELDLPTYGTSLSVTGRKKIGLSFESKRFLNDQTKNTRAQNQNTFDIEQELQIRMQGKVGPKITVNVDFDDTREDKQDISVVYTGEPNEVVQNASFGDIDLSLPSTEFVSYNKQLFGIRVEIKVKRLEMTFIGSRTKGVTKTKQFIGNTQFQSREILDTQYDRRRYYDLSFGNPNRLPIKPGSELIFLDVQAANANVNADIFEFDADDLEVQSSTFTGKWLLLAAGRDYTVDYNEGILTFRNVQLEQSVIAVDYIGNNGTKVSVNSSTATLDTAGSGRRKLLKTANDLPISTGTEAGYQQELKTFYRVGRTQIVRDNGRGNFFLRVLDKNRQDVGSSLTPQQLYPDTIEVDFENGLFQLDNPFSDPEIYAENPTTKFTFQLEYHFRLRTFFLEPNLVVQSETVLIDSQRMNRNVDYFIDYDSGFITFFNESRIRSDSIIDITYEVAPFGGLGTSSLIGMRAQYNHNKHWAIGSTLLYESGSKSPNTPSITDLAKSLLVYELDSQFKDLSIFGMQTNFAFEVAQSRLNPNLNDFAILDNMEGVKEQNSTIIDQNFWFPGANPTGSSVLADPSALTLQNEDVEVLEINPNAQANANETQKVLQINYDFNTSTEVSIVQPLSDAGIDFSQKIFLELTLFGANPAGDGPAINVTLGQVNEDADGTGGVTLNCASGATLVGVPKTEDVNCDGILSPSEDVGWTYQPDGKGATQVGANNGRIDSADLDRNSRLDGSDNIFSGGSFGYAANGYSTAAPTGALFDETANATMTFVNFSGWHVFQIPLNIVSTDTARWSAIKQVRISLRKQPGGANTGVLKLARLAVTGNSWKVPELEGGTTATMIVNGVNNVDNPTYIPIFNGGGDAQLVFDDLYGGVSEQRQRTNTSNLQEQALSLQIHDVSSGSFISTKRVFSRTIDISQHRKIRALFYPFASPTVDSTLVFRIGDANNFQEAAIPLKNLSAGWRMLSLDLVDLNDDQIPDLWENSSAFPVTVTSSGSVAFQQLSEVKVGLRNHSGSPACAGSTGCEIWINEIHVSEPRTRVGNARKAEASFDIPGWMSFGGGYRFVDRNFQTPTSPVTNRDDEKENLFLNIKRLSFLPMSFNFSRHRTVTPNTSKTGINDLVSLLEQDEVVKRTGDASANLALWKLPRMGFKYNRSLDEYFLLSREDDKEGYDGTLNYGVPFNLFFLPKTVDVAYGRRTSEVRFNDPAKRAAQGNFETLELNQSYSAKMNFVPWSGSTLNPEYALSLAEETRTDFAPQTPTAQRFDKSMSQTAGFNSNWRLLKWFNPSVRYTATNVETHNLNVTTVTVGASSATFDIGQIKSINRTGTGNVNLTLNMRDILPDWRLTRTLSFNNGYTLQDADVYNNVEESFDSREFLWIRTPLKPGNRFAERASQTLQDRYNSSQRWSPFESFRFRKWFAPFRTLSLRNNYNESIERKDTTGTVSKTVSKTLPDLIVGLQEIERLFFVKPRWMTNSQFNFKYTKRKTNVVDVSDDRSKNIGVDLRFLFKRFMDTSLSFNSRFAEKEDLRLNQITEITRHRDASIQGTFDLGKFRFTPKVDYTFDQKELGTGVISSEITQIVPSLLVRADISLPSGLRLPFLNRTLIFTNRVIWTTNASFTRKRSPVSQNDNTDLLNITTSGDYEIAKNLRMALNGSIQRLWHKFLSEEDFIAYQFGTTLTFQF